MLIKRIAACYVILTALLYSTPVTARQSIRISQPWEFLQGDLGGIWEAVRPATEGSPESVIRIAINDETVVVAAAGTGMETGMTQIKK